MTGIVTVLAGGRPELLRRTLQSVDCGSCLSSMAKWHFVINMDDLRTIEIVNEFTAKKRVVVLHGNKPAPIRVGMRAVKRAVVNAGVNWWIHLEDDWLLESWPWQLNEPTKLLDDLNVCQLRLRCATEPTWRKHAITRRPIHWAGHPMQTGDAHWTYNPALMPAITANYISGEERNTQRAIHAAQARGLLPRQCGQLGIGGFKHIGDDSLRLNLRR